MRRAVSSSAASAAAAATAGPRSKVEDGHVRVAVRCRPMSSKEIRDGHKSIVEFENGNKVIVNNIGESPSDQLGTRSGERSNLAQVFDFDAVFDWNSSQELVYETACKPIVDSVLEGYNGTIFAYGQTGTGKTFTMEGATNYAPRRDSTATNPATSRRSSSAKSQTNGSLSSESAAAASASKRPAATANQGDGAESAKGVIPRAFKQIFDHIAERRDCQFLVSASYMEIYQEEIHDLLRKDRSRQGLKLHERPDTGVYVKDLTWYVCKSISEIERVMRVGNQNRKVGATDMNERSSRSHAIFMITVEQQQQQQSESDGQLISVKQSEAASAATDKPTDKTKLRKGNATNLMGGESAGAAATGKRNAIRVGKLNLVDLAGSERQRKTNNSGQRHKESIKINLSLSALGNVINALKKAHQQQQQQKQQQQQSSKQTGAGGSAPADRSADNFIPYRDSALTRLLQDSLGGNSRTLMIANIGPASYNYDETINTLNYASRAKCIQNRPRLNEDPKDALLRRLQLEIEELRARLAAAGGGGGQRPSDSDVKRELLELKQKLASLEGKLLNGACQSRPAAEATAGELNQRLLQGYAQQQADQLERNRAELQDQASRERSIQDELERREEAELQIRQSFSSVRQEVDAKRNLVRQVLLRTRTIRDEFELKQGAYRLELDELDQLQFVLQRELRLKCLIMDNFIPNHHVNQLLPRIGYHEKRNTCSIEPIDLPLDYCAPLDAAGSSSGCRQYSDIWQPAAAGAASGSIRPRSEFERVSETINPTDARYKYENLLELRVEQPQLERPKFWFAAAGAATSSEANQQAVNEPQMSACYSPQAAANLLHAAPPIKTAPSKIQSLIEAALNRHESDIVI